MNKTMFKVLKEGNLYTNVYKCLQYNPYDYSMDSVVVSVRIKKDVKAKLEEEGINVEASIKDYLAQRAKQIEFRKKVQEWKSFIEKNVKPSKKGFAVKSIREDRRAAH